MYMYEEKKIENGNVKKEIWKERERKNKIEAHRSVLS